MIVNMSHNVVTHSYAQVLRPDPILGHLLAPEIGSTVPDYIEISSQFFLQFAYHAFPLNFLDKASGLPLLT